MKHGRLPGRATADFMERGQLDPWEWKEVVYHRRNRTAALAVANALGL